MAYQSALQQQSTNTLVNNNSSQASVDPNNVSTTNSQQPNQSPQVRVRCKHSHIKENVIYLHIKTIHYSISNKNSFPSYFSLIKELQLDEFKLHPHRFGGNLEFLLFGNGLVLKSLTFLFYFC